MRLNGFGFGIELNLKRKQMLTREDRYEMFDDLHLFVTIVRWAKRKGMDTTIRGLADEHKIKYRLAANFYSLLVEAGIIIRTEYPNARGRSMD